MTKLPTKIVISNLKEIITNAGRLIDQLEKTLETQPKHEWEHGDVYRNEDGSIEICLFDYTKQQLYSHYLTDKLFCSKHIGGVGVGNVKFLFNIKEKL